MPDLPFTIPENYSTLSLEQLTEIEQQARAHAQPLIDSADYSDEDLETLAALRDVVVAVRAERSNRTARSGRHSSLAADFTTEPEPTAPAPVAPAPEPTPTPEPALTAAAPRVSSVASRSPAPTLPARSRERFDPAEFGTFVVNPDMERQFTDWADVARFAERRLASYSGMSGYGKHTIATIQRQFPKELRQIGEDDDSLVLYATDESRLEGGSLTAAAGWCAPSQTIYDLCELETDEGMVDIPEIQISRGGLRFTPGPDFASIFGASGFFHQTEAQVIANTTKPCMEITCPAFTDIRLEVEGLCITGSILQRRGYPEMVARFIRGAMIAHMHKLNAFVLAQMVAGSTAVDLDPPVDVPLDTSATSGLLAAVEMAVEDMRYRNRMRFNATMEVVLPHWATAVMRADLSRRMGVELTNVTDAVIAQHFSNRGARLQYVYDWQDAFSGLATGPGGAAALTAWPNSVKFLIFPAGTWLRGSDDTIRLETVYDSTNLATNRYTALFTEEGVLVAQVCNGGSRVYEVTFCASGTTSSTTAFVCA